MRRGLFSLWLLWASIGSAADSDTVLWFPSDNIPTTATNTQAGPTGDNDLRCTRWTPTMGLQSGDQVAWGLTSGSAGNGSIAVYSSAGSTQVVETGAAAWTESAQNEDTTLSPATFNLNAGTPYWVCWCTDDASWNYVGTGVGVAASDPAAVMNAFVTNIGVFVDGCTAGETPATITPGSITAETTWRPLLIMFSKE